MEFNLLKHCNISFNTDIGNVTFDFYKTQGFLSPSIIKASPLVPNDILCFEADLLDRVSCSELRYYFFPAEEYYQELSNIVFSYKNYEFENFYTLTTASGNGYYYTTFSGAAAYPRYIRIVHNLGTVSGSIYGIEVTNDSSIVDFGMDASLEDTYISSSIGNFYKKTVPIYNNSNAMASAHVQVEAIGSYMDNYIFISNNEQGPWTNILSKDLCIADNLTWSLGNLGTDLLVEDGLLMLRGEYSSGRWASNVVYATYITKIFNLSSKFYSNVFIDMYNKDIGCYVATDYEDSTETFTVKSLIKPVNYALYRIITSAYLNSVHRFKVYDYSISNGDLLTVLNGGEEIFYEGSGLSNYIVSINKSGMAAIVTGGDSFINLSIFDSNFVLKYNRELNGSSGNQHYLYHIEADYANGAWIYVYTAIGSTSMPTNQAGYFLFHYTVGNSQTFKASRTNRPFYWFSVMPYGTNIWVTDIEEKTLKNMDTNGNLLYTVFDEAYTDDLRGCSSLEDGGCWFINSGSIYRVNAIGELIDSILNFTSSNLLAHVLVADDESLYVRDGEFVHRVSTQQDSKGFKYFTARYPYADRFIYSSTGVWLYCTTGYMYQLSEDSGVSGRTLGSALSGQIRVYGLFEKDMDTVKDVSWIKKFPITADPVWSSVDFSKVQTESYYFPNELYHQLQITLRTNKPYNKYNVPQSIDHWDPNDFFNTEVGYNTPYEHRWECHNKVQIDSVSGTCLLYCGEADPINDPHVYIRTNSRWYIKGEVSSSEVGSAYDIQVDYILPDEGDVTLYISVTPKNNNSDYIRAVLRRIGNVMTFKIEDYQASFYWGSIIGPSILIEPTQNSGKIRLKKNGARWGEAYFYNYLTNSWVASSLTLSEQGSYWRTTDFGLEKNWNIRIDAYGAGIVIIDNFKVNAADVYWYLDTPKLKGIYLQDYVTVDNIYPNNYKNVYIKTEVPVNTPSFVPGENYDYKIRAWWEMQL